MSFSNKAYNVLKPIALVWLPALGTLYFALAGIWGIPDATQVVGSITAIDAALGGLLHLSAKTYTPPTDGNLVVDKSNPEKDTYSLEVTTDLADVQKAGKLLLNVVPKMMA
jgi:hypothetical protein